LDACSSVTPRRRGQARVLAACMGGPRPRAPVGPAAGGPAEPGHYRKHSELVAAEIRRSSENIVGCQFCAAWSPDGCFPKASVPASLAWGQVRFPDLGSARRRSRGVVRESRSPGGCSGFPAPPMGAPSPIAARAVRKHPPPNTGRGLTPSTHPPGGRGSAPSPAGFFLSPRLGLHGADDLGRH